MSDADQRTEQATAVRRRQAREEGRVALSRDLVAAATLLAALLYLRAKGPALCDRLTQNVGELFATLGSTRALTIETASGLGQKVFLQGVGLFLPLALLVWASGAFSGLVQTGFLIRPQAASPQFQHVSALAGIGRLVSLRAGSRGLFATLKLGVLAVTVYYGGRLLFTPGSEIAPDNLLATPLFAASSGAVGRVLDVTIYAASGLLCVAGLDWFFQRWQLERDLRMTRTEVRDEQKEQESSPEVRRKGQRLRQSLGQQVLSQWSERTRDPGDGGER